MKSFRGDGERQSDIDCGAGGFIGGHLVGDLLRQGFSRLCGDDIKPLERWYQRFDGVENIGSSDLKELPACRRAVKDAGWVYNLAADMGGIGIIENNRAMHAQRVNQYSLAGRPRSQCRALFLILVGLCLQPGQATDPGVTGLKEADAYPAIPEDGYGWEKLFSERMCRHFQEDFGVITRVARYHNVYGPHGTWTGGREKAPAAVCRKVIEAQLSGNHTIEIWGNGQQTRSFMYIDDCLKGTQAILASGILEPINLGSNELVTINGLVDIVEDIAGIKLKRSYNLKAPKGVNGRNSDNTLIKKYLGWEPATRLRDGMEKTYRWIYDQMAGTRGAKPAQPALVGK